MRRNHVGRAVAWCGVAALVVALVLAGCAGGAKQPAPEAEKPARDTIVVALAREGETLDHIRTSWTTDAHYTVLDRLVERDYDLKYTPHLAESWTSSPDGMVWTFKLRKDVKFHDGTPFNAAAVKWFFEALLDPKNASPSASDYAFISRIETPDEYTVAFHLKDPYPNILFKLSTTYAGIISPEAYRKYGPDGSNEYGTKQMVGTGLYRFVEWVPGDHLLVTANPDHQWGPEFVQNKGPAHIKNIKYRIIPDAATRLMEFEAGNVDLLLEVAPQDVERVSKLPNVEVFRKPHFGLGYLAFATDKKPFNNVKVRQAINLAIDREAIVKSVFFGVASPAYGYLPPLLPEYVEDRQAHRYDPEAARKLLAEAGYPNGFKCNLATLNKTEHVRVAEAVQAALAKIGIQTEITQYDNASYAAFLKEGKQELFIREYSWSSADILQWFLYGSQFPYPNHSRWVDKKTDELIDAAEYAPSMEAREQGYKALQEYLISKAVWCPIWFPEKVQAVRTDKVANFRMHPLYTIFNDVTLK